MNAFSRPQQRPCERRVGAVGILLTLLLVIGGCASTGTRSESDGRPDPTPIAADLVYALSQAYGLDPDQTTVQLVPPTNRLGEQVERRLVEAGYTVERVQAPRGDHLVQYSGTSSIYGDSANIRYAVTIGNVTAERHYRAEGDVTVAASALTIGTVRYEDPSVDIQPSVNTKVFSGAVAGKSSTSIEIRPPHESSEQHLERKIVAEVPWAPAEQSGMQNMYETMRSNYASVFGRYEDVKTDILVFANDSTLLGHDNMTVLRDYAAQLNPDTDVISVIGCSHGNTDIPQGNALLATGRANRVKEGLLYAGVDASLILDEACYAPRYFDEVMPRRGVVLTHKRLKSAG